MTRPHPAGYLLVALAALALGYLLSSQVRTQLLVPSNRVARNQALVRSVHDLERTNAAYRDRISALRNEIAGLEAQAAQRSAEARQLNEKVAELRQHAGLTPLHGPGVVVELRNGPPAPDPGGGTGYLISAQDLQDVVNLLFAAGAEGVAVNGRRLTPISAFSGSGSTVVIDQGPPLRAPFRVVAVGNRSEMERELGDPSNLTDLHGRQSRFSIQVSVSGGPDLELPAYDASLEVAFARPA
ncbi:MAG TPA: DUF881 domain-containing protein [Candidatus Acidoferrales bacterium]|nr:DUF881 domain-containing protein [Candidatus Acidoferrales bacterium]